ncbi:cupin domain-containing protein [Polycladidibacter stylochi]|uniref:cupin domain-containing protein n=1 Tax=Polycladidibacter stylochi TaxID=1807766 RepID=UPI0009E9A4C8|nr:cupin domain-containing protein [Pseudovibrio stylochi]
MEIKNDWSFKIHEKYFSIHDWSQLMQILLPSQGAIEVQNDQPGKEFPWHEHNCDETLVILEGSLRFYWEGGERICHPGDVICLPKGMRHGSVALENGAKYIIAMHRAI